MKVLWRRRVLAAFLSLTAAALGGLLLPGTAHAQTVTTGSLSFSGDTGDYITQAKSYSYSTSDGDALSVSSSTGSTVSISVNAYNGDWWTLDFDAPGTPSQPVPGQSAVLVPGTYSAAHRYPFNGNGPGLSLSGDGRGCNTLTGSFTVTKAVFGAQGYVQNFDATFEQHCEGGTPAARGSVHIANAAAPPPTKAPTTNPRATSTSRPGAAGPTAPGAGPGLGLGSPGPSVAADNPAAAQGVRNAYRTPLLLIQIASIFWAVVIVAGLITGGIVMAVRRRT